MENHHWLWVNGPSMPQHVSSRNPPWTWHSCRALGSQYSPQEMKFTSQTRSEHPLSSTAYIQNCIYTYIYMHSFTIVTYHIYTYILICIFIYIYSLYMNYIYIYCIHHYTPLFQRHFLPDTHSNRGSMACLRIFIVAQTEVNGDAKLEADREAAAKRSSEGGRNDI